MGETLAINGQLPAKYLLSKRLRDVGIKVVLSGEGADEALLGYPHFKQDLGEMRAVPPPWLTSLATQNGLTQGVFLPRQNSSRFSHLPSFLTAFPQTEISRTAVPRRVLSLIVENRFSP